MKRTILAVALAVLAAPVLAAEVSAPYENTEFDRGTMSSDDRNASSGSTQVEGSVWADDYNFIAPAQ